MNTLKRLFFIFYAIGQATLCCLPFPMNGQSEALYFNRLTVAQNLSSQSGISDIFQDSKGFTWIGTPDGINRFNGKEVVQYFPEENNQNSLTDGIFQGRFFEDVDSNIWFSTYRAIHCYIRKKDHFIQRRVSHLNKLFEEEYQLIFLDTIERKLWVKIDRQVFLMDMDSIVNDLPLDELPTNTMATRHEYGNNGAHLLYVPTEEKLLVREYKTISSASSTSKVPDKIINAASTSLFVDSKGGTWLGTRDGFLPLSHNKVDSIRRYYGKKLLKNIVGIADVGDGRLIVATERNGIYFYSKKKEAFVGELNIMQDGIPAPFPYLVENIYCDNSSNIWISSAGDGIFYGNLKKRKFSTFLNKSDLLPAVSNHVKSLAEDKQGQLWTLTKSGISIIDTDGKPNPISAKFNGSEHLPNWGEPNFLYIDAKNNAWVCSQSGLFILPDKANSFQKVPILGRTMPEGFSCIKKLSNGITLATSLLSGVYILQEKKGVFFLEPYLPLKDDVGYSIFFEDDTLVYFHRNMTNILVFKKEKSDLVFKQSFPFKALINETCIDKDGNLWLATTSGLYISKVNEKKVEFIPHKGLPNQILNSVKSDEHCNLWIGSNAGLIKFNPSTGYHVYTIADGLQSTEFNMWASLLMQDGRLAFGGVNGINIFRPESIRDNPDPPIIHFTDLLINDTRSLNGKLDALNHLSFRYEDRTISFHFIGIDYTAPDEVRYKYMLKGYEDSKVDGGKNGFARYAKLPWGDYTFQVWAANSDGVWTPQSTKLYFTIRRPWYVTWWAITIAALIIISVFYRLYMFRVNQIKKKAELLRLEAEFKQQVAESNLLAAQTETVVLRLQMNPHFIFNSMNSISSYILKKDIATANDYLGRFAKLMRMILDLAAKPRIVIADEIELLELYMNTEAMRFEQQFTYDVFVDESLDPEDILIPTMILQPFVENAIWHGLSSKSEPGHIRLRFEKKNEMLVCSIEDNGVGRQAMNNAKKDGHESKALAITARRLQLLEKETGVKSFYEIIDIKDFADNPIGTKVEISVPLMGE